MKINKIFSLVIASLSVLTACCSCGVKTPDETPPDEVKYIGLDQPGDDTGVAYNLKYTGNDGTPAIYVSGMQNKLPFDLSKVNYGDPGRLFHPQVYLNGDRGRNDVYSAGAKNIGSYRNIYSPILIERDDRYDMIYGGWDDFVVTTNHGPVDTLYMAKIADKTLTKWQDDATNDRRQILSSTYKTDFSMFHINDPSFIDVSAETGIPGDCRLYFEMESLNSPASFDGSTMQDLTAPVDGEIGIPIHSIAMAESFDGGLTWNQDREIPGTVDRRDIINIDGISLYDYAYHQVGWPTVIRNGSKYLMYFDINNRGDYANKTITEAGRDWGKINGGNTEPIIFNKPSQIFPADSVVGVAESDDGVSFTFKGYLRNKSASGVAGGVAVMYNSKVRNMGDGTALVTYNAATYKYNGDGSLYGVSPGYWAIGLSYINLDDPLFVRQISSGSANTISVAALAFNPFLFQVNGIREAMAPQIECDAAGNILGIGYGQWIYGSSLNSYIAFAALQNYAIIKQDGKVIADFNMSSSPDTAVISSFSSVTDIPYTKEAWLSYSDNNLNPNRADKKDNVVIEVYDIYGRNILRTKPFTLYQGDRFALEVA